MHQSQQAQLDALRDAQRFLDSEPTALASVNRTMTRKALDDIITELETQGTLQVQSATDALNGTTRKDELRVELREHHMQLLAEIARTKLAHSPLISRFRVPRVRASDTSLITAALAIVNDTGDFCGRSRSRFCGAAAHAYRRVPRSRDQPQSLAGEREAGDALGERCVGDRARDRADSRLYRATRDEGFTGTACGVAGGEAREGQGRSAARDGARGAGDVVGAGGDGGDGGSRGADFSDNARRGRTDSSSRRVSSVGTLASTLSLRETA
jgi:uncharacterized coiled-coil protein SlyX